MRVVSLLPSATEILCSIGGGDLLVGRSHECDHPAGLEGVPVLTGQTTRYEPAAGAGPAEIDQSVRTQLAAGQALYTLDAALLADLRPDVILTQDLCAVCSIDLGAVRVAARELADRTGREPRVVSLDPHTVEDILDDVLEVGRAVGLEERARHAIVDLRGRFVAAQEHVSPYAQGPIVGFLEWTDPLFVAGHWTVQLIERAGGRHPLNETVPRPGTGAAAGLQQGERVAGKSIAVPPEVFQALGPERLVVAPCGLTLPQALDAVDALADQAWFSALPAVAGGHVAVVDGSQMFNRPGPRVVDAFEWLVAWLHGLPELIPGDFPWREWRR